MKSCHRTEVTATVDSSVTAAVCQWGPGDLPRNRLTESCYLLLVLTGSDIFFWIIELRITYMFRKVAVLVPVCYMPDKYVDEGQFLPMQ